jgi:prophage regulatory protein
MQCVALRSRINFRGDAPMNRNFCNTDDNSSLGDVLRLPQVIKKTGLRRSTIYAAIQAGRFPPPIRLGPRSVGWLTGHVESWLRSRADAEDGTSKMGREHG